MTDEGEEPVRSVDGEAMMYDYFKHLTSLSLLTLGGVLSISQFPQAGDIKKPVLTGVLVAVAAAGVLAFSGAEQIVRARASGKSAPNQVVILQRVAPALLSVALGAFLYIFVQAIN